MEEGHGRPARRATSAASAWRSRRPIPTSIYAIVEAADGRAASSARTDRGVTWEKRNAFDAQAQYYAHIVVDPKNTDRIYVMNVLIQVSDDGGKTLAPLGERWKHVDNHDIWIDPKDPNYYLVGCDGGIYESYDRGANWQLQVEPAGHAVLRRRLRRERRRSTTSTAARRTTSRSAARRARAAQHGIINADWFVVQGGDGFHCKVDPKDPNIVYAELQYGGLVRFDRRTGERVRHPAAAGGRRAAAALELGLARCIISPHNHTRLYFAANRLFRSDDRGDSWKPVSPRPDPADSTATSCRSWARSGGRTPSPRTSRPRSTATVVALAESPKKEGLIYVGTDDGLIQVTEDGGKNWRKIEKFPGVPANDLRQRGSLASQHDAEHGLRRASTTTRTPTSPRTCLKSTDAGKTWTSIAGDLPARGTRATASPRITSIRTCCSSAPSSACSSRSTAARSGTASRTACRRSQVQGPRASRGR